MKKIILILGIAGVTASVMAFNHLNAEQDFNEIAESKPVDFLYNVDSKFFATITKEKLMEATNVVDLVPSDADWEKFPIKSLLVASVGDDAVARTGAGHELTDAQIELLRSLNYSESYRLKAHCVGPYGDVKQEEYDLAYWVTVVPEKEANYSDGMTLLLKYLKKQSQQDIKDVTADKLAGGQISFWISEAGKVEQVELNSSCGYKAVDKRMMELIKDLPGNWAPATNAHGETVPQELVFSYGQMGC